MHETWMRAAQEASLQQGVHDTVFKATHNALLQLVVALVIIDTIFGVMRAVKERKFNSSVGINGALRKVGMMISLCALIIIDSILSINMIGFIPDDALNIIGISTVGLTEFFAILYAAYETVSVLKNMYLSGLPVKSVWDHVYRWLRKYTEELPDDEGQLGQLDKE